MPWRLQFDASAWQLINGSPLAVSTAVGSTNVFARKPPCDADTFGWSLNAPHGFSLMEILLVLGITSVIAAMAIPNIGLMVSYNRLSGDARTLSNSIAVAKMRASANFT